jgi:hypothetical protein
MAGPTNLTISYLVSSGSPSVSNVASVTVTIASFGADYSSAVSNIKNGGGAWITSGNGVLTWIPLEAICQITAQ